METLTVWVRMVVLPIHVVVGDPWAHEMMDVTCMREMDQELQSSLLWC